METFKKQGEKLKVEEPIVNEREYTMGEIDNNILYHETKVAEFKKLRREGEKLGLREVFNIPKQVGVTEELQDIKTE